jgi:hypothetical protein
MPSVFFSYSHADEDLRDQLEKQLSTLKRQGVIETWHDRRIGAGNEIDRAISERIETDDLILLLVSPDFIASDYCYDREMRRAMERHESGDAIVIPVILRPCDWHGTPFGKLLAVPTDGKPVTQWPDRDQAFLEVAKSVREAAARVPDLRQRATAFGPAGSVQADALRDAGERIGEALRGATERVAVGDAPRSSNLRLAKQFTERDKDRFRLDSFDFMAKFFENSLDELAKRNPGIEGKFRRIDANRFVSSVYRDGQAVARCTVFMGGTFGASGINYVQGETTESNSFNETLRVEADDQSLFLLSMGMASMGRERDVKLTQQGAAELYWSMLIGRLQERY